MSNDTTKPVKSGWKTTEFWATAATSIVVLLNQAFGWNIPPETLASLAGAVAAYVISRGVAKK